MAKQDQIARWMLDEIRKEGRLNREHAAYAIADRFGQEWVYVTDRGGIAIDRRVLTAFERLTKTKVVFANPSMYWRMRRLDDLPGRRVEE